jgi:shikimate dehydrogenase
VISGATRVAAVIGHPVAHSLSPALHRAGFASLGVDWVYVAFDVAPGDAADAVEAMRTLGLGGLSVTMPHKHDVAAAVDRLEPAAAALWSANTVSVGDDGALVGASTDGDGFVAALADADVDLVGRQVGVLGAGGAARSIVDALARGGAAEIVVVNRTVERAHDLLALAVGVARVGTHHEVAGCDIVVNTTPVGMGASGALPIDTALLREGQVVADIVYHPRHTPLLAAAEGRGCRTVDGLGMLVHQAALQELRWIGELPDVLAMRAEAERQLAERGQ